MGQINQQACIKIECDGHAIFCDGGNITQAAILFLTAGTQSRFFFIGIFDIGLRAHLNLRSAPIDNDRVTRFNKACDIFNGANSRNTQRARNNRNVTRRAAFF